MMATEESTPDPWATREGRDPLTPDYPVIPRWRLDAPGRVLIVDARKVTAGGRAEIRVQPATYIPHVSVLAMLDVKAAELDKFAREWLAFRQANAR